MCSIRLTWVLSLFLIQSGVQSVSAQNTRPSPPFGGPSPSSDTSIAAPGITASDLAAVRDAIGFAGRGRPKDATDAQQRITDPAARKLVEWAILRSNNNGADFARLQAFIAANPNWPNIAMFRRRAESMLWEGHADVAAIRALTGDKPISAKGRFALGRALLAQGDRAGAQALIRDAWRTEPMPFDAEEEILETFGDLITQADDKARMEHWLYANDTNTALRAAIRLGGNEPIIVKARAAANDKASNAKSLIEGLPSTARQDAGVLFSRIQMLRRADKISEAAQLMLSAPRELAQIYDSDAWWVERRLLARKLLDTKDTKAAAKAYRIVRDAAPPTRENLRIEQEFTAGWIALRFLKDPAVAADHFGKITGISPTALARASYWRGRAADAMNKPQEARAHYEQAANYSTAYYGQLARAKLGLFELALAPSPVSEEDKRAALAKSEIVRAVEILYATDQRDLIVAIAADLAERGSDLALLAALVEQTTRHEDARCAVLIGRGVLGRGYAFDREAFPAFGLPRYTAIAPEVEPAVVYSIARQESGFNAKAVSSAHALGLMQVTPEAGRYIAQKFNVAYDQGRLLNDTVYNMQIGTAQLADDIGRYNGSYVLAFAGYNAGRGRVKEWIERYGDPRDPKVDPVDWVERIPFPETRNYVQRIIEGIQVYRVQLLGDKRLLIEADLVRGTLPRSNQTAAGHDRSH